MILFMEATQRVETATAKSNLAQEPIMTDHRETIMTDHRETIAVGCPDRIGRYREIQCGKPIVDGAKFCVEHNACRETMSDKWSIRSRRCLKPLAPGSTDMCKFHVSVVRRAVERRQQEANDNARRQSINSRAESEASRLTNLLGFPVRVEYRREEFIATGNMIVKAQDLANLASYASQQKPYGAK